MAISEPKRRFHYDHKYYVDIDVPNENDPNYCAQYAYDITVYLQELEVCKWVVEKNNKKKRARNAEAEIKKLRAEYSWFAWW